MDGNVAHVILLYDLRGKCVVHMRMVGLGMFAVLLQEVITICAVPEWKGLIALGSRVCASLKSFTQLRDIDVRLCDHEGLLYLILCVANKYTWLRVVHTPVVVVV